MRSTRFPRHVYASGEEPDPRFSLANERTFLAWVRTALPFLAGAVALEALATPLNPTVRMIAALVLVATALVVVLQAWIGWVRIEKALRNDQPLPSPLTTLPVTIGLLAVTVLVALGLVLGAV